MSLRKVVRAEVFGAHPLPKKEIKKILIEKLYDTDSNSVDDFTVPKL